jgi:hypothetical protein
MKLAKALAFTGTVFMLITLIYGFVEGDFFKEGGILFSMTWGKVSLIEIYVGFLLFSSWVFYREEKWMIAAFWVLLILIFGNFITFLYVTKALYKANDDVKHFWLGSNFVKLKIARNS